MNIFDSFVSWLDGIGSFFQSLYEANPEAFLIAIFSIIVILIIIIIALAKAKSRAEGNTAIKYDDIDFSTEAERKAAATAQAAQPAVAPTQPVSKGLPEPVTEEELRPKYGAFDVPTWMTKQTMSIDEANMIDADQWVGEQLSGQNAQTEQEPDKGESLSAAEFNAAAATGVIMSREPGEPLKEVVVNVPVREMAQPEEPAAPEPEPVVEEEPAVIHLNEYNISERGEEPEVPAEPEPEPEPEVVHLNEPNLTEKAEEPEPIEKPEPVAEPEPEPEPAPTIDTDTLAKIMREHEELWSDNPISSMSDELDMLEAESGHMGESISPVEPQPEPEPAKPEYGINMSDAIRDEKPGIIAMRTLGEDPSSEEVKREYDELLEGNIDFAGNGIPGLRDQANPDDDEFGRPSGAFGPRTVGRIHYGAHNRDTNRSGVKFTVDELMETIRD